MNENRTGKYNSDLKGKMFSKHLKHGNKNLKLINK